MSTEPPLVSIVIPTFNYGRYVIEAVESALAQTYRSHEVIVVDDGSTDDTRERLAPYLDRIRYIYQDNAGLSAARNTGIRAARGQYIALLDSDDQFHPRRLELQVPVAESDTTIGIVTSCHTEGPEVFWKDLPPAPILQSPVTLDELILRSRFGSCGVLVRRECFDSVGYFDESLRSVEDRDMWIRIATRYRIVRLTAALWWYRTTPGSMSRNPERMEYYERVVLDKAFRTPELAGRWRLRRKAMGLADLASSYVFGAAGQPATALKRILRSFVWWPLPFRKPEVHEPFVRVRILLTSMRRMMFGGASPIKS